MTPSKLIEELRELERGKPFHPIPKSLSIDGFIGTFKHRYETCDLYHNPSEHPGDYPYITVNTNDGFIAETKTMENSPYWKSAKNQGVVK